MILFPAIDLIGGKVVRLERGDRSRCKVYSDDRGRCPLVCRAGRKLGACRRPIRCLWRGRGYMRCQLGGD